MRVRRLEFRTKARHSRANGNPEKRNWIPAFAGMTVLVSLFFFHHSPVFASPAKAVREGNNKYNEGDYDAAFGKYNEARAEAPDSDIVQFNLGDAMYKKGMYQEAAEAFSKVMNSSDKEIQEKAAYNAGNSKYKLGSMQEGADLNSAISSYQEALGYYKKAMELDKGDDDVKHNHDLAEKKIKELQERKQQQQQQQGQDKKDDKESQDKSGQEKQGDKQQKSEDKQGENKGDKGNQNAGKNKEEQSRSGKGEKTEEMSLEEARTLLETYGEEESGAVFNRQRQGHSDEVQKDW